MVRFVSLLSDSLSASEEELTEDYKGKIASFVNNMPQWYSRACNSIIAWAKDTTRLMHTYKI